MRATPKDMLKYGGIHIKKKNKYRRICFIKAKYVTNVQINHSNRNNGKLFV